MHSDKINQFFEKYPAINYKKGDKILRPNEYSNHIYMVKSGYVRGYKLLKTGQEITFSWYDPSVQDVIIFGYTQLLSQYHIEAFSDVIIHRAPKQDFNNFVTENPEIKDHIIRDLSVYFGGLIKQVEWLSIPDAYTRIKAVLYTIALRASKIEHEKVDKGMKLTLRITHQLLASFTGLTRETVTIQINKLASQGYISRKDNAIIIEDLEGLVEDIT